MLRTQTTNETARQALVRIRQIGSSIASPETSQTRILRVVRSMLLSNGLTVIIQLVMVPTLLWAWGPTRYGEWLILYTIPGYLSLTDFGIIATANNKIDSHCARGYFGAANRTYFNSVLILSAIIGLIFSIATLLWIAFGGHFYLLFKTQNQATILTVALVLFLDSMLLLVHNHHSALYRTIRKFDVTVNWQAGARVIPILLLCATASLGGSLAESALTMLSARFIIFFLMVISLRKKIKWMQWSWLRVSTMELKQLLRGSLGFMTIPLSNMIYLHVSTIVVAALTSPTHVAAFSTIRTFTRLIPQIASVSGRARWSEISQANAKGDRESIKLMWRTVLIQTISLSSICTFGYFLLGERVYTLWTGGALQFEQILFLAMVINAASIALYYSSEVFLLAINKTKWYSIVFLTSNIVQMLLGVFFFGLIGSASFPIFGAACSMLVFIYIVRNARPQN